jgi:hypothetical protein
MGRFFATWTGLGLIATIMTFAVAIVVFKHIDVTFTQFAILLVAPAAQALVLTWPAGTLARLAAAVTMARRHSLAQPVLLLDLLLLLAGMIWWSSSALGFGADVTAQTTWIGVKALAGAAVCVVFMRGVSYVGRITIVAVLLLTAAHAFSSGLERTFALIDLRTVAMAEVFLRLFFYGGLYVTAVMMLLRSARALSDDARMWMSVAIACSVAGALVVLLSMFNTPVVMQPWRGLALMCASGGVTAMVLCVLTQSAGAGPRP